MFTLHCAQKKRERVREKRKEKTLSAIECLAKKINKIKNSLAQLDAHFRSTSSIFYVCETKRKIIKRPLCNNEYFFNALSFLCLSRSLVLLIFRQSSP